MEKKADPFILMLETCSGQECGQQVKAYDD